MITQVITTLLLTLCAAGVLFLLFRWVKTPYYRVDIDRIIHLLEMVLTGQATDNDWQMTVGMTIRHQPELEALRQKCLEIEEKYYIGDAKPPYLFSAKGLAELEKLLLKLKADVSADD